MYKKNILYIMITTILLFMIISIFSRQNVLMLLGIAVFAVLFITFLIKSEKYEDFFSKNYFICLLVNLLVVGVVQLSNCEEFRFIPSFDLDAIYGGAIQWIEQGSFYNYYEYYNWFPNNLGGMCVLYFFFRIGKIFTSDYFLIAAFGNEICILLTFLFISLSAKKIWGKRQGLIALLVSECMLPLLYMTDVFYTDSLSMLFPVLLFFLYLHITEREKGKILSLSLLSALVAATGIFIKGTVGITVIAIALSLLALKKWKHFLIYIISFFAIAISLSGVFQLYIYNTHLDYDLAKEKNTPYTHWIMMGLNEEGAYSPQDYEFTRSFSNPIERDAAIRKEIGNRISEYGFAGMLRLYSDKIVKSMGDGTLGISDFLDDSPAHASGFHRYILYEGSRYTTYKAFCNLVYYSLLLLCFFHALISLLQPQKSNRSETIALALSSCGIICFLMIWESSARYITNYVPILILLAVAGGNSLATCVKHKKWDRNIKMKLNKYSKEIKVVLYAVGIRLVMYLFSVVIMAMMGEYENGIAFSDFLETWKRWDSTPYINIAQNTYAGAIENGQHLFLVFYPLYPWLMRFLSFFIEDFRICGMLISVVGFAVGSLFFYKITEREFGDKAAANAVLLISVFPFAFFFGSIATESLFFAVATAFFYYLRKHKWTLVALFGFLACLTRIQGVVLAFAVLVELFYYKRGFHLLKNKKWKQFLKRIIYPGCISAAMLGGILVYFYINYIVEGNPFQYMYYQKNHWGHELCPIWKTFVFLLNNVAGSWDTSEGMCMWVPELVLFGVYAAAIIYGFKRIRPMYWIYLVTFFLLTYSVTWLISAGRYTLGALPIFMLLGDWISRHEKYKTPIVISSAMLMAIYMVGFYSWKQIM